MSATKVNLKGITELDITGISSVSVTSGVVSFTITSPTITWDQIGNAAGNLTLANAGYTTTFNQTSAVAWTWANTTTGTSGTTNSSPLLELSAQYYTGSATGTDLWTLQSSLASGTNGASTLTVAHSGSTGAAILSVPSVIKIASTTPAVAATPVGTLYSYTGNYLNWAGNSICLNDGSQNWKVGFLALSGSIYSVGLYSGGIVGWSATTQFNSPYDTGFSRLAAGSIALGNGSQNSTSGTLALSRINSYGADMQGNVSSAPTGIVCTTVVVAVGAATATFTVSSTEGFTVGDTVTASASGWTAGAGVASSTATVTSITNTTTMVLTRVSGGPWVAGTYSSQTGTLAQTGGTSVTVTFAIAYTATPTVVVTPTSNAGAFYLSAVSTTGFTITYATSGTKTFNYHVMGNPN